MTIPYKPTSPLTAATALPGARAYDRGTYDADYADGGWVTVVSATAKTVLTTGGRVSLTSGRLSLDGPEDEAPLGPAEIRALDGERGARLLALGAGLHFEAGYDLNSGKRLYAKSLTTTALRLTPWQAGDTRRVYVAGQTEGSVSGQRGWGDLGWVPYDEAAGPLDAEADLWRTLPAVGGMGEAVRAALLAECAALAAGLRAAAL